MERFPVIEGFNFYDLTFTADARHVTSVCEQMLSRKMDVVWWAESRLDLDLNLLEFMSEAGCRGLSVGLETGSPRILKSIHKNVTLDMLDDLAAKCDSLDIWLDLFLMFSIPDETPEDMQMTMNLVRRLLKRYERVMYPANARRRPPFTPERRSRKSRGALLCPNRV